MMNGVLSFLRRSAQTRATVHDLKAQQTERVQSARLAYRLLAGVQILTQLMLWWIHWLYMDQYTTSWLPMLLQFVPAIAVWVVWGSMPQRPPAKASLWLRVLLVPCAWVDGCVLLVTLSLLCQMHLPHWPSHYVVIGLYAFVVATVAFSGKHGVAYGVNQIRTLLFLLLVGELLLPNQPDINNLSPLLGKGMESILAAALSGIGGVWGIALLFALPKDATPAMDAPASPRQKRRSHILWALVPVLLVFLWSFWLCLCNIWQAANPLLPKEKMVLLTWRGTDLFLLQVTSVFYVALLAVSLMGNTACAVNLIGEAIPKSPKNLTILLHLLVPMIFAFFDEELSLAFIQQLLPYRFVLAAAAGLGILWVERKRKA